MAGIIGGQRVIQVGVVEQLSRYPVKSMRAEALTKADVGFEGIAGIGGSLLYRAQAQTVTHA